MIANYLNDREVPTRHGDLWTYSTISQIITNPTLDRVFEEDGAGRSKASKTERLKSVSNAKRI